MSHDRGIRAQNWLAVYLREWWPDAAAVGSGRRGADIENTPGVHWENKTADQFKPTQFIKQARESAAGLILPVVVYWPRGVGEKSVADTISMIPTGRFMPVLEEAGYAPRRERMSL